MRSSSESSSMRKWRLSARTAAGKLAMHASSAASASMLQPKRRASSSTEKQLRRFRVRRSTHANAELRADTCAGTGGGVGARSVRFSQPWREQPRHRQPNSDDLVCLPGNHQSAAQ
ncbi:hypothetical protein Vretimale_14074 [Volvox reticuliferus]|uniref:Uncharacterized protein n=1 Tax=Volvox reticuliferus TaxID=1737510 RepID=A0A8J4LTJ7_9CHLO|nr:hypothetical protein Vretifemale_16247 [Volvox reticuliferus]GIM10297.1 hypothetical protein Vretimale_14074 [Volvox reticuliferus]